MHPATHRWPIARIAFAACVLLIAAAARAAGPWITETGGSDMGLAGAGRAALALDAAALSANPAALAYVPAGVTIAAVPLALDYEFAGDGGHMHASNQQGVTTLPAAYAVAHHGRWTYGLGAYSCLGMSFDSGADWGGQRAVERAGLATFNLGPALAWRVTKRWSVGGSVAAQWSEARLRVAVSNDATWYGPPGGLPDGELDLRGSDWSPAGQLGITYEPRAGVRLGATWTAPVRHRLAIDVGGTGLHPVLTALLPKDGASRVSLELPQQWLAGVSRTWDNGTSATAGLSWQDWSAFGEARFESQGQTAPILPAGLRDTWGASLGLRRPLGRGWMAATGVRYESSPATDRGVPAYFPVAAQWHVAAGVERQVSDSVHLRAALSVTRQDDVYVVQAAHPLPLPGIPQFTGTYAAAWIYALGLGIDWRP